MSKNRIKITGYPKIDDLYRKRLLYKRCESENTIKVLFAPTHNMNSNDFTSISCYPRILSILKNVSNDIRLIFSLHPANNNNKITTKELVDVDVVLTDSGSLIYEAWALDIPVVFPSWLVKNNIKLHYPNSFEDEIYDEEIGYHVYHEKDLFDTIKKAYEYGIKKESVDFIEGILPRELRGYSGEETANCLLRLI